MKLTDNQKRNIIYLQTQYQNITFERIKGNPYGES